MKVQLNFDLLPELSRGSIIRRLDDDLESPLAHLPQTCARAKAAISFSHEMDLQHDLASREAYLRASLAEYVSMEDTLERDLKTVGITARPIRVRDSANPLLHIVRELRNLEIHLRSSRISASKRAAQYKWEGSWRDIELDAWWIEPITEGEFAELRNARNYHSSDVTRLLDWFNRGQKVWGVDELVRLAVNGFAREIVKATGLMSDQNPPEPSEPLGGST